MSSDPQHCLYGNGKLVSHFVVSLLTSLQKNASAIAYTTVSYCAKRKPVLQHFFVFFTNEVFDLTHKASENIL
jgi:hypothetical protein